MIMKTDIYLFEHLATLLSYPTARIYGHTDRLCRQYLNRDEAASMRAFADYINAVPLTDVEALFTKTFDLNPGSCLEVGWHLYGEEYERGAFLVNMRQALAEEGIQETVELPDHLSHCLRLLPRLEPEDAKIFAHRYLQPALAKIMIAMGKDNPYTRVIEVLQRVLEHRYGVEKKNEPHLIELPVIQ